jgi:aminopeptidase-like protein
VDLAGISAALDVERAGGELHALVAELFPTLRSITGDGFRHTLEVLGRHVAVEVHEVPSGTQVFDWTVPPEWNARAAWIEDPSGRRVVDLADSSLHLVSYSVPVDARMSLAELRPHLHALPDQPDLIPYRTSYYARDWGFCLPQRQLDALPDGDYRVLIDATLTDGHLTWGECLVPGASEREVLISTHACHPSLANDNLSGVAVATLLAWLLAGATLRHSYRFLFIPGTIGSITWLARNQARTGRITAGLVLACLGDPGGFTYKRSRRGDAPVDRAVAVALRDLGVPHSLEDFSPYGYDERQYCSPGFDLPVGCLNRTPHGRFPEYHTSADDLGFVRPGQLGGSLAACLAVLRVLEDDGVYRNLKPHCEPQLGRRGLYGPLGGRSDTVTSQLALLWVLNLGDGRHTLVDVAERSGLPFDLIHAAAQALAATDLLARC